MDTDLETQRPALLPDQLGVLQVPEVREVVLEMSLCECGCGHDIANSPSMFFRWPICQTIWLLSQHEADPEDWRARERENLIFASMAPYWSDGAVMGNPEAWTWSVRNQYAMPAWEDAHPPPRPPMPATWLPELETAMPYLIVDWYAARERWVETGHYGTELYEPRFLIPAKA